MEFFGYIVENGSVVDLVIFLLGLGVFGYVWSVSAELQRLRRSHSQLRYKYNQLNTLMFGTVKIVQSRTGVNLIHESANGQGDYTPDWGVE